MRVAALYDIHGNLPALEAVLQELRREDVERVVVGGDVVPGPMPRETLAALLAMEWPTEFIRGNGEAAVLDFMAGREPAGVPAQYWPPIRWNAEQLSADDARVLASWPKTLTIELGGKPVLFCHATPRNEFEIFTERTPQERVPPGFAGVEAKLVVCGHTHMQFNRTIDDIRVVNAGSIGMPFGDAGADWLLLTDDFVQLRHTSYDLDRAAERVRRGGYPQAEDFAKNNILRPPSREQMMELFEKRAMR